MRPQENPARVLLGLHGNSTQGFLLNNLYCLECSAAQDVTSSDDELPQTYSILLTLRKVNTVLFVINIINT